MGSRLNEAADEMSALVVAAMEETTSAKTAERCDAPAHASVEPTTSGRELNLLRSRPTDMFIVVAQPDKTACRTSTVRVIFFIPESEPIQPWRQRKGKN